MQNCLTLPIFLCVRSVFPSISSSFQQINVQIKAYINDNDALNYETFFLHAI